MLNRDKGKRASFATIIIIMIIISILLSIFLFPSAFVRLFQSFKDFGLSVGYYFCEMFEIDHKIEPTVKNRIPVVPIEPGASGDGVNVPSVLPDSWNSYKVQMMIYGELLINGDNIYGYMGNIGNALKVLVMALSIILPLLVLVIAIFKKVVNKSNNKYNIDTAPLKFCKTIYARVIDPIKWYIIQLWRWFNGDTLFAKSLKYVLVAVWVLNSNAITVLLEFIAFYLYFVMSFDVANIYVQVLKLVSDITPILRFIPALLWVIIALWALARFRRKIGYARLNHGESINCGVIKELPICIMINGTMGAGKTKLMTDIALSNNNIFRRVALEKIIDCDMKFPMFPWIVFEKYLQKNFENDKMYNLATIRQHIGELAAQHRASQSIVDIFGYDIDKYDYSYNDSLKVQSIWQVLDIYAQCYFIYICETSFIQSNYGIRIDSIMQDQGNFPLWNMDFFKRDPRLMDSYSRCSHILNFDSLRLGKRMNDRHRGLFEFGIIVITEIGKERGNTLDVKEVKKSDKVCNRVNDLFNHMIKLIRHVATVDYYPFVCVLCDDQRAMSLGADARELCQLINIDVVHDKKQLMPFFFIEELLHDIIYPRFVGYYSNQRYIRGDNTMLTRGYKLIASKLHNHYARVNNLFGSQRIDISQIMGSQDGKQDVKKYYLASKKIYSDRYATDCYAEYLGKQLLRSIISIVTMEEYECIKPTLFEFNKQYSHFIGELESVSKN